jgi:hypothetical protein
MKGGNKIMTDDKTEEKEKLFAAWKALLAFEKIWNAMSKEAKAKLDMAMEKELRSLERVRVRKVEKIKAFCDVTMPTMAKELRE